MAKIVFLALVLVAVLATIPVLALDGRDLKEVTARLSRVAGQQFQVEVKSDSDLNAWAKSDGSLGVTSGMLSALATEDELAFVLAHEMAHVLGKHHKEQTKKNVLGALGGLLLAKLLGADEGDEFELGAQIGAGLVGGKHSRKDEYRADAEAVRLMAKAGYCPKAGVSVLKRLQNRYGNGNARVPVIGWFASHPDTGERIKRLKGEVKKLSQSQPTATNPMTPGPTVGPTVVVVLDPEAGYSYGWGFGRGYYYTEDLSRVAKQETEVALEKKGFQVLVSTQDVGPLQEELVLENSEWGKYGEGRKPIGYFAGADVVFYISAHVARERGYDIGDWRRQARIEGLKVGVLLRQIDLKTRRQVQTFRGTGSVAALSRVRVPIGEGWDPLEVELEWIDNLARRAVGEAVRKTLSNVSPPAMPATPPAEIKIKPRPAPEPAVRFLGVGDELRLGTEPITLGVRAPKETAKVIFAVYSNGQKRLEGETSTPPFRVTIRPEMLRSLASPTSLEAIAFDRQGQELGRASIALIK